MKSVRMIVKKLKDVAEIKAGYQARKKIDEIPQGKYRLIQAKDFDAHGNLQPDSISFFAPERKPHLYEVKSGDLLLQSRGLTHNAYCIKTELEDTLAAGSFYILRLKTNELLPRYLCWWLNQNPVQDFFNEQASGTLMSFVSKAAVSQVKIRIPDMDTQQKIVYTMSAWRRVKSLQNQLTEEKERLIHSLCMNTIYSEESK